jgi:cytoskeletal protein CcmA (bactofilin family)
MRDAHIAKGAGSASGRTLGRIAIALLPFFAAGAAQAGFQLTDPASPIYFTLGAAAGDEISVEGGATVTGSLHSNGRVTVKDTARVTGDVSAADRIDNRGTITGSVTPNAPARQLPALFSEAQARALADRTFEQETVFANTTINDTVFVHGKAKLQGAVNGVGTIIATGDIEMDRVDPGAGPGLLQPGTRLSLIAFQHVMFHENRSFRGVAYAGGHVMIEGNVRFEGVAVAQQQVQIRQGATVVFLPPDSVPPVLTIVSPTGTDVLGPALPPIVITYGDSDSGIAQGSLRVDLDGVSLLGTCTVGPSEAHCQAPPQRDGVHSLLASIRDRAGNRTVAERAVRTVLDAEPPRVSILTPADGALLASASPRVTASLSDAGSGVDPTQVRLAVDGLDRTPEASVSATGLTWTPPEPLAEVPHTVTVEASDRVGHTASASVTFRVDVTPPALTIAAPAAGLTLNGSTTEVAGTASDESGPPRVEIDGQAVPLVDGAFHATRTLADGAQTITVRAVDAAGNARSEGRTVTRFALPEVSITAPADLSYVAATTVRVTGTVSDPAARVVVNGVAAVLAGTSFTAEDVPLVEGGNIVTATATDAHGHVVTDSVNIVRDLTAPRVVILDPEAGAKVFTPTVTVTGMVNDIVAGTVNASEATVTVNGRPAQVANRSFVATGVPLTPGDNTLTAEATDAGGNRGQATLTVKLAAASVPRIAVVSGDLQTGGIDQPLAQPLVVALLDAAGQPVAGRPVLFAVRDSSGTLDGGLRQIAVATGPDGRAAAHFTLGSRAGVANQAVEVSAVGFAGPAVFHASARAGVPKWLLPDAGTLQVGIAGEDLPQPLVAAVTDAGYNRLAGVDVRLRVIQGGGRFANGLAEMLAQSDSDGRIVVPFTLGPEEGVANNVVEATVVNLDPSPKATFVASGRIAGDPAATSISGVVLDNQNQPVPGVTLRIKEQPARTAQADAQGLFRIAGAPVGTIHLIVDGSTSLRPGSWPDLEFVLTTIPGRDNTVNMPIYLLPIDVAGGVFVDETRGGVLTLPEFPGFALEVQPGSVTFPGGSRSGVISVTAVHGDKVPMVPNFGQQPRFIVTIQPAGARFDPPARLVLPNLEGLAPGEVTEMYSFDHDLGHFVSIGPGTVSEDGMVIVSNPGVGVVKAGWHCGGNPAAAGTPADCPLCQICDGNACVPGCSLGGTSSTAGSDIAGIFGAACTCDDHDDCTINDHCDGHGGCTGDPVNVTGVTGQCVTNVSTAVTLTAQANDTSRVKWISYDNGTPPDGKGATFPPKWPSLGIKKAAAYCKNTFYKTVTVLNKCSDGVSEPSVVPETPSSIPPGYDGYFLGNKPKYVPQPCTNGPSSQYCLAIVSFESRAGYTLITGKTDVASASDPVITAANCKAVLQDLTPSAASTYGQPPTTTYWSRAITERHEQKHQQDWLDMVLRPTLTELKAYAASKCQGCSPPAPFPQADLDAKEAQIVTAKVQAFDLVKEPQAFAQSNAEYQSLVAAIRQRAQSENWSTDCQ